MATIHSPISKALQSDVSSYTCACLDLTVCGYVVFSAISGFQRDGMIGESTIGPHHGRQGEIAHWFPTHVGAVILVEVKGCHGIDPVHIVRGRRQLNRMKDRVTQINIGLGAKGDPIGTTKRGCTRGAQLFNTRYNGIGRVLHKLRCRNRLRASTSWCTGHSKARLGTLCACISQVAFHETKSAAKRAVSSADWSRRQTFGPEHPIPPNIAKGPSQLLRQPN
jgi:hypothetical protein